MYSFLLLFSNPLRTRNMVFLRTWDAALLRHPIPLHPMVRNLKEKRQASLNARLSDMHSDLVIPANCV